MKFQNKLALEKVWGFARRNSLWIALIAAVAVAMNFSHEVINTAMLIVLFEAIALGLSGFAAFVYTKVDFTRTLCGTRSRYHRMHEFRCVSV